MAPFELAEPRSLQEAFSLLGEEGARPFAGGTALMLMMKAGVLRPTRLVSLRRLGLDRIDAAGGALAHADPHMDLPPLLAALGARATIEGKGGKRVVPVEDLYAGYLENTLGKDLITEVTIPPLGKRGAAYLKCTTRSADDWPAVGVAVVLGGGEERIFVSAATDRPTRIAGEAALKDLKIEGDQHGSARYKRQLLKVYLKRALDEARKPVH